MHPVRLARRLRWLTLVATTMLTACAGTAGPTPTLDPSASPVIRTASDFCGYLDALQGQHQQMRQVRLRQSNRRELDDQYDDVVAAWDTVRRNAPDGMSAQLKATDWAVIDLGLAVLDYQTNSRLEQAADHVLRRDLALDRALARLRARTDCPPWVATPRPLITPTAPPSPSGAPSASPSADPA